jgi:amino-acid N-acetyltransferase
MSILFRKARMGDARAMHTLLNHFAFNERRELLPRSLSEIYENLQQFHVAEDAGRIVGTCALYVTWDNLAEVKALCVDEAYQKRGIGRALLDACLKDAQHLDIRRIFTLTVQPGFFEKYGFGHVSKSALPHKVWTECVRCPYFPERCIEYAMVKDLPGDGPEPPAIQFKDKQSPSSGFEEGMLVPSEPTEV